MKALTFHGKHDVRYENVPDPVIEDPSDVIVRVRQSAICGSDLHVFHEREKGLDPGTIMGHELVGEVVETGREVSTVHVGQIVVSPFSTNCGRCFYCRRGLTSRCPHGKLFGWVENGEGLQGVQAEMVRVPLADATLLLAPPGASFEEALLLGDVLPTGFFCAKMAAAGPGGVYVVLGCGPVGLMAVVSAIELGAEVILALDAVPARLKKAQEFGAQPLDSRDAESIERVLDHTDGRGADAVLEAVGSPQASRSAMDLVRPGGIIAAVGVHTEERFAFSPIEAYDKNLTYRAGRCPARYYMERLYSLVQARKYDLSSIFTHRLPLAEGPQGYAVFDQKKEDCLKVLLEPGPTAPLD